MTSKALRLPSSIFGRDGYEKLFLFCLPSSGRDALLSMCHRLYWDIWEDADGHRVPLTNEQMALMELTEAELTRGIDMTCLDDKLGELIARLEDLEMSVIVNNYGGGGCGCGCSGGGSASPGGDWPTDPDVPTLPNLPLPTDTPGQVAAWCDRSNEIAGRYVGVFQTLSNWWDGVTVTTQGVETWITYHFGSYTPVLWPFIITQLATALTFILTNSWVETAKTTAENMRENLICAVYNATNALTAKAAFDAVIDSHSAALSIPVRAMLKLPAMLIDWSKVVDLVDIATDPIYEGSVCTCGEASSTIPDDEIATIDPGNAEYYLVPVDMIEPGTTRQGSGVHTIDGNLWTWVIEGGFQKWFRMNVWSSHYAIASGEGNDLQYQYGFLVQVLENNETLAMSTYLAGGTVMHKGSDHFHALGGEWFHYTHADVGTLLTDYLSGYGIVSTAVPSTDTLIKNQAWWQVSGRAPGGVPHTLKWRLWMVFHVDGLF